MLSDLLMSNIGLKCQIVIKVLVLLNEKYKRIMRACVRFACVRARMSMIASDLPWSSLHMFKGRFGKRPPLVASLPVSTGALGTGAPLRWHYVPSVIYAGFLETGYQPKKREDSEVYGAYRSVVHLLLDLRIRRKSAFV